MAHKRINKELEIIGKASDLLFTVSPSEDLFTWAIDMGGPAGTPYEGGVFKFQFVFPTDYPFKPPKVTLTTKIYHCNVDERGHMCLAIINESWSPSVKITDVMKAIAELLIAPNTGSPVNADIAALYTDNRKEHDKNAREWTAKYAK